jgi:hypothetical protein|nr:MAG TPA: thymidylate synthase, flavin-dependent [Caudoviricetes sp.]
MISAEVILDTDNQFGHRITTMRLRMPRYILAQFNTHRVFSRNTSSSRAVPTAKLVEQVRLQPFMPIGVAKNGSGMLPKEELPEELQAEFLEDWGDLGQIVADFVEKWAEMGVHKQHANRALEPWLMCEVLVTSTEWQNFFDQRCEDAQPEMCDLACKMRDALGQSTPKRRVFHLPFVTDEEMKTVLKGVDIYNLSDNNNQKVTESFIKLGLISAGRCCRVSYLRTDAESTAEEAYKRGKMLVDLNHWSPLEHQATNYDTCLGTESGNLKGFIQLRQLLDFPN